MEEAHPQGREGGASRRKERTRGRRVPTWEGGEREFPRGKRAGGFGRLEAALWRGRRPPIFEHPFPPEAQVEDSEHRCHGSGTSALVAEGLAPQAGAGYQTGSRPPGGDTAPPSDTSQVPTFWLPV